jgi:hypothetical protein
MGRHDLVQLAGKKDITGESILALSLDMSLTD